MDTKAMVIKSSEFPAYMVRNIDEGTCIDITDEVGGNVCVAADSEAVKLAGGVDEIATMLRGYLRRRGLGAFDVGEIGAVTTYPVVGGTRTCENVGIVVRSICDEPGKMPWLHVTID